MEAATLERAGVEVPERSLQQRREALKRANGIRSHRAQLKLDLKQRRKASLPAFSGALHDPDCATMKVVELLLATPKIGRVKANRILTRARVSPSKTIGGLTQRQRDELAAALSR